MSHIRISKWTRVFVDHTFQMFVSARKLAAENSHEVSDVSRDVDS